MKKILLSATSIVLALSVTSSLAADLPSRKGPPPAYIPPPPLLTWQGFYVGVNAGYAWGDANFSASPGGSWIGDPDAPGILAAANRRMSLSGGTVGGTLGYNHQFDHIVVGLEIDGGWMGLRDPVVSGPFPGVLSGFYGTSSSADSSYLFTTRGRLGYTITPTLLVFASGGLAVSDVNQSQTVFFSNPPAPIQNLGLPITLSGGGFQSGGVSGGEIGWTVGGGLEWMFHPNWSAKVEYLHADFGKKTATSYYVSPVGSVWALNHEFNRNVNIVRAGLNYHFNWGSVPVVAKY